MQQAARWPTTSTRISTETTRVFHGSEVWQHHCRLFFRGSFFCVYCSCHKKRKKRKPISVPIPNRVMSARQADRLLATEKPEKAFRRCMYVLWECDKIFSRTRDVISLLRCYLTKNCRNITKEAKTVCCLLKVAHELPISTVACVLASSR